ncbi:hypothetical protein B7755_001110 [Streptomyces sp. NBS 14/10]|uniref:hypothetical protein n=1 Tax=Streptomyces sp. NBS 14/10 TaxID=1945643 RepID=UPI0015C5B269|nr:hypothetical protein [Streptomyces sp. NBS 14/10]KAK1176911.1 hypothetical protein B7755_001110 [Streptomyces sp. NBS 14/10]NUP44673.1 hypothetical protein [Streptomyces sp.]NUS83920.1 hypothetical protein [Streptomyces sp.]
MDEAAEPIAAMDASVVDSRRHDPIQRSEVAFIRGTWGGVAMTCTPIAWKTASKLSVKFLLEVYLRIVESLSLCQRDTTSPS